ncbi:uncharacterized protein LOC127860486 [Dreissena polymorpha]|uniref:RRM domain-containing protein n=1 Tax=Dreissena polymorpha TaxID=45954 RepID=A0A9D3YK65_DREPO|nr:uncharacterized protein LOC127860486 [Dreissena polymorpha]XP_052254543.1 uncharacterized protein LOC127860486 [Dreissena polymorpha]XP_052254544.1 uncharacterized protein LOC127860486 [Dreissena polymorpha]XP_052254545.1 uncharacterized protein LOC127860486 [Dreissena polymorpha]XP_052254546.1 uncharacterized protein LOC127860486 [Dreissena polymorpha]KAH3700765.1 hypothetical protein DPMN_075744 [Dreissena polymorpha]
MGKVAQDKQKPLTNSKAQRLTRARIAASNVPVKSQEIAKTIKTDTKPSKTKMKQVNHAHSKKSPNASLVTKSENNDIGIKDDIAVSVVSKKTKYSNTTVESSDDSNGPPAKKPKYQYVDAVEKLENSTSAFVPKKLVLVVGNLPEEVTKEQLMEHFKRTGGVKSVKIPKQKGSDLGKGLAYVEFKSTISHRLGVRLHNTTLAGKKICVDFAPDGKLTERKLTETIQQKEEKKEIKMPFDT